MGRLLALAEERLLPLAVRAGEQRHLQAIRDGVVSALPLVLIGSAFLLIAQPPVSQSEKTQVWSPEMLGRLLLPFRITTNLIAIYVAFSVAHSLARGYGMDGLSAGLLSAGAFLIGSRPSQAALAPGAKPEWVLPMASLGAGGLFVAIIVAIFAVEVQRLFIARNWTIKMPAGVPPAVGRSFAMLLPAAVVLTAAWVVFHMAGLDVFALIARRVGRPLSEASNSLPGVLLVVLIDSALWLVGIHAVAVLAVMQPIWLQLVLENQAAHAAGAALLPNIGAKEFYIWFVWIGGSGASLCLPFIWLRARSAALRGVAKVALLPSLCNINEPVIFGAPIVMNGVLAAPFVLAPLAMAALAWCAFHFHWVMRPYVLVPWTLPGPLGAYFTTGGDWRALVLVVVNLGISVLIYLPFAVAYDRRLASQESAGIDTHRAPG